MSKGPVKVSAEEAAKNQAFLASMAASGKERYIKRHSLQARLTHGITIAACILLCISGLFVFVPALAAAVGADTVFAIRMSHRIIGVVFVAVPLISALLAPKGVAHIFKNLFDRWDSDDKKWMMLFFPYLFMAKSDPHARPARGQERPALRRRHAVFSARSWASRALSCSWVRRCSISAAACTA